MGDAGRTMILCEVDRRLFPGALPDFGSIGGDSWENAIGDG